MANGITIGQYFPGQSLLHRMDPRVKLVLTFAFIFMVFIPDNWVGLGLAVAFLFFCVLLSRLPIGLVFRSIKAIIPLIIFTSILNMIYVSTGDTLLKVGVLHITTDGVNTAVFMSVRILTLIAGSSLLTFTTTPTALTDALERLLSPLRVVRLNVHELAMMMTIALRFIPTLIEETEKIMAAQKARGAELDTGGLIRRIKALIPVLIPLFISSFRRAYELATAMECRCYRGGKGRTRMKQLRMRGMDYVALLVTLTLAGGLFALNFVF